MKITRFEQSGFIFETGKGFRLAVDIASRTPLENISNVKADAVIISHFHQDHFSIPHINKISPKKVFLSSECIGQIGEEKIKGEVVTITSNSAISIEDIKVQIFDVDHGPNVKVRPLENFGFLFTVDNETIYFAGDMFYGSGIDVTNLEVDYALLPVGSFYTFGPREAFEFAKTFKKISKVVAMHDRGEPGVIKEFLELAKGSFIAE